MVQGPEGNALCSPWCLQGVLGPEGNTPRSPHTLTFHRSCTSSLLPAGSGRVLHQASSFPVGAAAGQG